MSDYGGRQKTKSKIRKKKGQNFTGHIKIIGHGESLDQERLIKIKIKGAGGGKTTLIRIDDWYSRENTEIARLNQLGAHLISRNARTEFSNRIQAEGPVKPTFLVATRTGSIDGGFVLPDFQVSRTGERIETYFNDIPDDILVKYNATGTLKGWKNLARYARGNSRMMFGFALTFVGPLSAFMPVEFVSGQFVAKGGEAKTAVAAIVSSTWGYDPNPTLADKVGFGVSWNNTLNNLERVFGSYHEVFLFLDETRSLANLPGKHSQEMLDAVIKIERSVGKGRLNDPGARRFWNLALLSTSNGSVMDWLKAAGLGFDASYFDRLPDIPSPDKGHGIFEDLYGFADVAAFSVELKRLAFKHHGHAGREFIRRLFEKLARDPKGLIRWIEKRRAKYIGSAKKRIVAEGRDLTRLHGKFATIYAAGALAILLGILPFKRIKLLQAIRKCEADHVAFIAKAATSPVKAAGTPFDRLLTYIRANHHRFLDLGKVAAGEPVGDQDPKFGYRHDQKGKLEFLFSEKQFKGIVGGKGPANSLKPDLDRRDLIGTTGAGKQRKKYVVRRHLEPDRSWVVV